MDNINFSVLNIVNKHYKGEISFDNLIETLSEGIQIPNLN